MIAQRDGGGEAPLAMERQHARQVDRRHQIAIEHQQRVLRQLRQQRQGSAGAERGVLAQVLDAAAEARPITEVIFDHLPEIADAEEDPPHAMADQQLYQVLEDRPVADRQHRLGDRLGQLAEALALAAGHDHRP